MYTLLNNTPVISRVDYKNLNLDYVRKELIKDADSWISYRRTNPAAVQSNHLLVKILQTLNVPYDGNLTRYRDRVAYRVDQFSGIMGLTSGYFRGKLHTPGVFYGQGYSEVIISVDEDWDMTTDWRDWEPVRILSHPRSDFGVETLDGRSDASEKGYATISLNIPMLACQCLLWSESDESGTGDLKRGVTQFLMAYPLTNALRSHLDVAYFNRLCRRWYKEPVGESYRWIPIYITDLTTRFDQSIDIILDRLSKQAYDFEDILKIIPGIYRNWSLEVHRLPKIMVTNQCLWALYLARFNLIGFLVSFCRLNGNQRNGMEFNRIKRSLIEAKSGKYLVNNQPIPFIRYCDQFINDKILPYL